MVASRAVTDDPSIVLAGVGPDPGFSAVVTRARAAQEGWAVLPVEERCERILRLRDALVDEADALVESITRDTGRPPIEGLAHEVFVVADLASHLARRAPRVLAPEEHEHRLLKHRRSYVHRPPRGLVAVLAPPVHVLSVPLGDALTALVAGNAVVVSAPEGHAGTLVHAKGTFEEAGLPTDLFQVVPGGSEARERLLRAGPDFVVAAGLPDGCRRVAALCGELLIPSVLLVGGRGAAIVCNDADVERAARALVFGAFASGGRSLIAVERAYAHVSVYEALVDRVSELAVELRVGDGSRGARDVGPVGDEGDVAALEALVRDAASRGARVRVGGTRGDAPGVFLPTVLEGCAPDMAVMATRREGPILPLMRVGDDEEAIRLVNEAGGGLVAHVFSRDRARGRAVAERLRAGSVMINDVFTAYATPETPFGGVGHAGWGRVHGDEGLRAMCDVRHVSYDRFPLGPRDPLWFPYSEAARQTVAKGLRVLYRRGSAVRKLLDLF